jgi:hypothetical protein
MKHKYIIAGSAFLAFLFILSAIFVPQIGAGEARSVQESILVESDHPYADNEDAWWEITVPGADWVAVHFDYFDVERRYDYIYLYDIDVVQQAAYTGKSRGGWSPIITGETVYVRLVSDSTKTRYGFTIDLVEYEISTPPPPPPEDTEAPVVSITAPTESEVVSDTVTVSIDASDNVGVANTYLSIDGGAYFSVGATYNWDTTTVDDGAHTLQAKADDAAGNEGFSTVVNVDVDNTQEPPPVQDGDEHFLGAVAGTEVDYYEIYAYPGTIAVSVSWDNSYDIDCYIMATPDYTDYLARGYTTSNPETCSYYVASEGYYYIGVRMYTSSAASTDYDCHVTWQAEEPPPPPPPSGDQFAVIVGISDYKAISDLSYCDEDATDWYNYLTDIGYADSSIRVLGDTHASNYPAYYALATEYQYKACLDWLASLAATGAKCAFITSGHGSGDGSGSSFLCAWDCYSGESGEDGDFYDTEVDDKVAAITAAGAYCFVFIDHCYSGGMAPELMAIANSDLVYCTTTCSDDGYGYDDSQHQNGMWTYWFLEAGLIGQFGSNPATTMEQCFAWAASVYPQGGGDAPEEYDGNPGSGFQL